MLLFMHFNIWKVQKHCIFTIVNVKSYKIFSSGLWAHHKAQTILFSILRVGGAKNIIFEFTKIIFLHVQTCVEQLEKIVNSSLIGDVLKNAQ